jgi:hypothetical protein
VQAAAQLLRLHRQRSRAHRQGLALVMGAGHVGLS